MRLAKNDVERRQGVAANFFRSQPNATGEAFNKALTSGELTGSPEPAMGSKAVYTARKLARAQLAAESHSQHNGSATSARAPREESQLSSIAKLHIKALQDELSNLEGVVDLTIRKDGTVSVGLQRRDEVTVQV